MSETLQKIRGPAVSVALAILAFVAFSPALSCGFVDYDDPAYVFANPHLRTGLSWEAVKWSCTAMHASNWHPLTWISHALDCSLYGLNPAGHHLTNLLVHSGNVVLLFALLRRLTGAFWPAALVAALFAVHPLRVESVVWVSERKDVLSVGFGLLAMLAYVRFVASAASQKRSGFGFLASRWYWLALIGFALSLLSKPMLVTLPCLLLLLDFWPLRRLSPDLVGGQALRLDARVGSWDWAAFLDLRPAVWRRLILEKVPFFILVAGSIPLTLMAQAQGGAVAPMGDIPLATRFINSAIAVGWYGQKLVWPADLAVIYPLFPTFDVVELGLGVVIVIGGSGIAVWQAARRPEWFTGWFWFLGTLVPVVGLVQVGMQRYADRYTYFSYVGLFLILAWSLGEFTNSYWRRRFAAGGAVIAVGLCAILSWKQCHFWKNSETLFRRAASVTSGNYVALNNLGFALAQRHEYERAIECYQEALRAAPRYAEALNNLGCSFLGLKKFDLAAAQFRAALEIKPNDLRTLNNLGTALHELGDYTNAVACYQRAVEIDPAYGEAHLNLANSLAASGQSAIALHHYERVLELQPGHAGAHLNYGIELLRAKRLPEAESQFAWGLSSSTNGHASHYWMAAAARARLDFVGEIKQLRCFLAEEPSHAQARLQLAMALAAQGETQAALIEAREAATRHPDNPVAQHSLGVLLAEQGDAAAAVEAYQAALRMRPDYPEALNNLAWLLAANQDAKLRNGHKAVELATRACTLTRFEVPMFVGTLAAAHAEAGQFSEAMSAAERAITGAQTLGETNVLQRNRELLELYRAGRAYHEPNPKTLK